MVISTYQAIDISDSPIKANITGHSYYSNIWGTYGLTVTNSSITTVGGYDGLGAGHADITLTGSSISCVPHADYPGATLAGIACEGSGNLIVTDCTINSTGCIAGLYAMEGKIVINSGDITASATGLGTPDEYITVRAGVYAAGGITIGSGYAILTPKNGKLSGDRTMICGSNGKMADSVVIGASNHTAPGFAIVFLSSQRRAVLLYYNYIHYQRAAGAGGSISPSGQYGVPAEQEKNFTITATTV